jgi:hypothetical protein
MYEYGLVDALKKAMQREGEVSEHLNGIYAFVPADVQPPYIRVQAHQDLPLNPAIVYGDVTLTLVSRYRGQLQITKLLNTLRKVLQSPLVTQQGYHMLFKEESMTSTLAADNITQSVTLNFRVKLKLK